MEPRPAAADARATTWRPLAAALGLVAALALFAWRWLDYADVWIDDAFITFRYARSWAEGLGPVYNAGERVQGYTNFLWMALSALAFRLVPEPTALTLVRAAGGALGAWVLWRTFRFPGPAGEPRLRFGVLLLAAHPLLAVNASDGLETPLFAALLLESARAAVGPLDRRHGAGLGLLTAALALTRPDALPLAIVWPALTLGLRRAEGPGSARAWGGAYAACALGPIVAYGLACTAYYGGPLPNTYVAKATGDVGLRLAAGARELLSLLGGHPFLRPVSLWIALGLALAAGLRHARRAPRWVAVLAVAAGSRVAFEVWSGGAFMGVFRFLAPALPPLVVLADEGARGIARRELRVALALALALGVGLDHLGHERLARTRGAYGDSLERAHVALGRWLREQYPADAWLALGDAGAVPFYSRLPTIDLWGLNDHEIARLPGEYGRKPGTAAHALARAPRLFVLWSTVPRELGFRGGQAFDRDLHAAPDFRRHYRFVREYTFRPARPGRPGYYLRVFERSGGGSR